MVLENKNCWEKNYMKYVKQTVQHALPKSAIFTSNCCSLSDCWLMATWPDFYTNIIAQINLINYYPQIHTHTLYWFCWFIVIRTFSGFMSIKCILCTTIRYTVFSLNIKYHDNLPESGGVLEAITYYTWLFLLRPEGGGSIRRRIFSRQRDI
jgi:hypothetical protein